jgi:Zn-dependent protease
MQSFNTIQQISIWLLPILFAITLHEAAHGWVAMHFGDKTALLAGRISLNPLRHIDLIGTILVPAVLIAMGSIFIFGWAKPVPVNWQNLYQPRRDMALVALAGPSANLFMALLWACIAKLGIALSGSDGSDSFFAVLIHMGQAGMIINLLLMIFNLFPIPPLDGSRVLSSLLPPHWAILYNKIEPFGFVILLVLLFSGALFPILKPIFILFYAVISHLFGFPDDFFG